MFNKQVKIGQLYITGNVKNYMWYSIKSGYPDGDDE
jgi:hypothetical protein